MAGAALLCCAGPALLILAATGVGTVVLHAGPFLVAGIGLTTVLAIGGLLWSRRRTCARPAVPALHGSHEPPQ